MTAAITDKFTQATNGTRPSATTLTALHSGGDTTMTCAALNGWPTATAVHFIVYTTDTSGNKVAGSQTDWKGVVSGTNLINCQLKAGTDSGYSIGAIVECAPTAAWAKDMADGMIAEHEQDGTHGAITPTSVASSGPVSGTVGTFDSLVLNGAATSQGWTAVGALPTSIVANGSRGYLMTFNSVDLTGSLSKGMRLQGARSAAAPTQCASLNGTTQYFTRASGSLTGHSFTDDFVATASVYKTAYSAGFECIQSRYNGTSGWALLLDSGGRVLLQGINGAAGNYRRVVSNVSIPLNKEVHIAAQLDMSSYTLSPTTCFIMIDGVEVSSYLETAGTNPTSISQAGNYEIGSWNGGLFPFSGRISQVALYNAKVAQATLLASMNQALTGTETSLISAYSLANSVNDLNANANNLTAQGGATTTTTGGPFGCNGISSTLEYGIISDIAFSTNTTVYVQAPEGCLWPTTGGIGSLYYSTHKLPYGFPSDPDKWSIVCPMKADGLQAGAVNGTFYNIAGTRIALPKGPWLVMWKNTLYVGTTAAGIQLMTGLSTSASGATDPRLMHEGETPGGTTQAPSVPLTLYPETVNVSAAITTYYLISAHNSAANPALYNFGGRGNTQVMAIGRYGYL